MSDRYPYHLLARLGTTDEVTEWEHMYEDVYSCRCCGQHRQYDQLTIVKKGGRL
jgi:hypothetical protein